MKIAYFGGEPIGVPVLEELKACGIIPNLIVCSPDQPSGRKLQLTPPPVKIWAESEGIEVFQPPNIKNREDLTRITKDDFDVFVVVAYNHLMPEWLINLPSRDTLNLHPSLLPLYRGPSPIRTAILEDNREAIGVSVMHMDSKMDHGPLIAKVPLPITDNQWPVAGPELDIALARLGGATLARVLPNWIAGTIETTEQVHTHATYTRKFNKADGELTLDPHNRPTGVTAWEMLLRIKALAGWPGTYFFHEDTRIKVIDATIKNNQLEITKIIPAGKNVTTLSAWLKR